MDPIDVEPYGVIYMITNRMNGKIYVGQTINTIAQRWRSHCNSVRPTLLWLAIQKYGRDAFLIEKVDEAIDRRELDDLERLYIAFFRTTNRAFGYNYERGGASGPRDPEAVAKGSAKLKGRKLAPETVKKIAATKRGRPRTPAEQAVLDRMAAINTGRRHSECAKQKMADAARRRTMPEFSDEWRAKLSAAAKRQWATGRGHSQLGQK